MIRPISYKLPDAL